MSQLKSEGPRKRRRFTEEFKQSAVRLVVNEGYTFPAAAPAIVAAVSLGIAGRTPRRTSSEQRSSGCSVSCGAPRWSATS